MCHPDAPFYLQPNAFFQKESAVWFKCQALGVHPLGKIMKTMAAAGAIPGRKTNHSGRKTTVKRLRRASIDPVDIIQLTGHKNIQSLNHYSGAPLEKQKEMTNILVKRPSSQSENIVPVTATTTPTNSAHTKANFAPATTATSTVTSASVDHFMENDEDRFLADIDTDAFLQSMENFEAGIELKGDSMTTNSNITKFTSALFAGANITVGTFNMHLHFGST